MDSLLKTGIRIKQEAHDVAIRTGGIASCDTVLYATPDEWRAFRASVKAGEFDDIHPD